MMELYHHGIKGQRWGVRRWQNEDGTYTQAGLDRYFGSDGQLNKRGQRYVERRDKKDLKWAAKNEDKIINRAEKDVKREAKVVDRELKSKYRDQLRAGKIGYQYMFERNSRMAELMNSKARSIQAPSGKTVSFVAKRRELGVYVALGWQGADLSAYKRGVFASGKIGYKNAQANMQRYEPKK